MTIPIVLGVILVVVVVLRLTPGDPVVALFLGQDTSGAIDEEMIAKVRGQLGLDRSLPMQYLDYIWKAMRLDFGRSFWSGEEIRTELLRRWPATLELGLTALAIAYVLGISAGLLAAYRPNSWLDNTAMFMGVVGMSIPRFWLGFLLMILFGLKLGWLPIMGRGGPPWTLEGFKHIIMPALCLSLGPAALIARLLRTGLVEVMESDYVRTAWAKGLSRPKVVLRHAARNAFVPVLAVMGLQFGQLLAGTVIIETVFTWPGLGSFAVEGIMRRDYPIVQATVIVVAIVYVMGNLLADILAAYVDPRIRLQ
jgi:ABC-type dipeptide/oligopeptide/nickel transport system permease component